MYCGRYSSRIALCIVLNTTATFLYLPCGHRQTALRIPVSNSMISLRSAAQHAQHGHRVVDAQYGARHVPDGRVARRLDWVRDGHIFALDRVTSDSRARGWFRLRAGVLCLAFDYCHSWVCRHLCVRVRACTRKAFPLVKFLPVLRVCRGSFHVCLDGFHVCLDGKGGCYCGNALPLPFPRDHLSYIESTSLAGSSRVFC